LHSIPDRWTFESCPFRSGVLFFLNIHMALWLSWNPIENIYKTMCTMTFPCRGKKSPELCVPFYSTCIISFISFFGSSKNKKERKKNTTHILKKDK
jgi:hypothetical protein